MTAARSPAEVCAPGEFLREELDSRGWTQVELAEILDRPPRLISELVSGKRAITPETAVGLAAAFSTSAELWMKLEAAYQLSKTSLETSVVRRRAKLYGKFPVKEMIRRGWIADSDDVDTLEDNFLQFFGMQSLEDHPTFKHAAKKQEYDSAPMALQLAWLNRAEHVARSLDVGSFSAKSLKAAIGQLQTCLQRTEDVKRAPSILAAAGVRFVVVEYLPSAKLDGACFWINRGRSPVIALSLRLDRLDNFWHTLFHEIDHIANGEGKETPIIDVVETEERSERSVPAEEKRANISAANYCIEQATLDAWISTASRPSSKKCIMAFADQIQVHPALVVGQLQHRRVIPYSYHRDLLHKVRTLVIEAAVTDGYSY